MYDKIVMLVLVSPLVSFFTVMISVQFFEGEIKITNSVRTLFLLGLITMLFESVKVLGIVFVGFFTILSLVLMQFNMRFEARQRSAFSFDALSEQIKHSQVVTRMRSFNFRQFLELTATSNPNVSSSSSDITPPSSPLPLVNVSNNKKSSNSGVVMKSTSSDPTNFMNSNMLTTTATDATDLGHSAGSGSELRDMNSMVENSEFSDENEPFLMALENDMNMNNSPMMLTYGPKRINMINGNIANNNNNLTTSNLNDSFNDEEESGNESSSLLALAAVGSNSGQIINILSRNSTVRLIKRSISSFMTKIDPIISVIQTIILPFMQKLYINLRIMLNIEGHLELWFWIGTVAIVIVLLIINVISGGFLLGAVDYFIKGFELLNYWVGIKVSLLMTSLNALILGWLLIAKLILDRIFISSITFHNSPQQNIPNSAIQSSSDSNDKISSEQSNNNNSNNNKELVQQRLAAVVAEENGVLGPKPRRNSGAPAPPGSMSSPFVLADILNPSRFLEMFSRPGVKNKLIISRRNVLSVDESSDEDSSVKAASASSPEIGDEQK